MTSPSKLLLKVNDEIEYAITPQEALDHVVDLIGQMDADHRDGARAVIAEEPGSRQWFAAMKRFTAVD